jgi:hypothetical protein
MATIPNLRTHKAYAFSRTGKKFGRLLECGTGCIDKETGLAHVFMDRGPILGYTGYIVLSPLNAPPPKVEPPPTEDDDEEDDYAFLTPLGRS